MKDTTYLVSGSTSGGKFWEIEINGRSFTTRYGKIGANGTRKTKPWHDAAECEKEAKKLIAQKKKKGYKEGNKKKRKQVDTSEDESESDDDYDKKKKAKKTVKPPPKKKRKKIARKESDSDDSASYDSEDIENEKELKKMLKISSVLLQNVDENKFIEVVINGNGKSYSMIKGKIGNKGRKQNKKFTTKKKTFDAALDALVSKMHDGYTIVDSEEEASSSSESSSSSSSESEEEKGIFSDYSFAISGGFSVSQSEIRGLIKDNGGTYKMAVTSVTDFLVVKSSNANFEAKKCVKADEDNIPIVTEDFIHDSIKQGKMLKYKNYIAESEDDDDDDGDDDTTDNKKKQSKPKTTKTTKSTKTQSKTKKKSTKKKLDDDDDDNDNDGDDDEPKKSKQKIIKMRGSAPVDEYFTASSTAHVCEDGTVWDAMLNQTNIKNNNNKFYKLQVLEEDDGSTFYCWFRWGRVGYKGQNSINSGSKSMCIDQFKQKFYDKTLNEWEHRNDFEPHARKYTYLPMDYSSKGGDDDPWGNGDDDDDDECKIESKLHENVQDLVELIFDKKMMEDQLKEIGYDADKLPLGKVDQKIIKEAYEVLKDIEGELNAKKSKSKKKSSHKSSTIYSSSGITDLSSRYYTLIPHEFNYKTPPPINSYDLLKKEMKLIEALSEIEVATKLLRGDTSEKIDKHPIDKHFDLLKTELENVNKNEDDFKMIEKYVKLTHASTHNRYSLSVQNVFRLDRDGSSKKYKKFEKDDNRMLLWHGSRLTNFVGIISQGLRIAPPEAPVTGYMFGKGVYFADMCSKSANYCFTSPDKNTGLILLCEVALGEMNELLHSDYYAGDLPSGKSSTKGCGKTSPDPSTYQKLPNGCVVPVGKAVVDNNLRSSLLYNEYIVYDTSQIKMKYLIKLKFNYKNSGGWF